VFFLVFRGRGGGGGGVGGGGGGGGGLKCSILGFFFGLLTWLIIKVHDLTLAYFKRRQN